MQAGRRRGLRYHEALIRGNTLARIRVLVYEVLCSRVSQDCRPTPPKETTTTSGCATPLGPFHMADVRRVRPRFLRVSSVKPQSIAEMWGAWECVPCALQKLPVFQPQKDIPPHLTLFTNSRHASFAPRSAQQPRRPTASSLPLRRLSHPYMHLLVSARHPSYFLKSRLMHSSCRDRRFSWPR